MNPNTIAYRKGAINDLEALQELALISYGVFKTVLTPDNWKIMETNMKRKELFSELLGNAETFVAECDGKMVGMVFLTPSGFKHPLYDNDWSVIRFLGVHPEHNGKGIAKYLTQKC